jgi:hypothetical protein
MRLFELEPARVRRRVVPADEVEVLEIEGGRDRCRCLRRLVFAFVFTFAFECCCCCCSVLLLVVLPSTVGFERMEAGGEGAVMREPVLVCIAVFVFRRG